MGPQCEMTGKVKTKHSCITHTHTPRTKETEIKTDKNDLCQNIVGENDTSRIEVKKSKAPPSFQSQFCRLVEIFHVLPRYNNRNRCHHLPVEGRLADGKTRLTLFAEDFR